MFGSNTDHALVPLYADEAAPSAAPPSEDDKPNCTHIKGKNRYGFHSAHPAATRCKERTL